MSASIVDSVLLYFDEQDEKSTAVTHQELLALRAFDMVVFNAERKRFRFQAGKPVAEVVAFIAELRGFAR